MTVVAAGFFSYLCYNAFLKLFFFFFSGISVSETPIVPFHVLTVWMWILELLEPPDAVCGATCHPPFSTFFFSKTAQWATCVIPAAIPQEQDLLYRNFNRSAVDSRSFQGRR